MPDEKVFTPVRYACKGRLYDSADNTLNVVLVAIEADGTLAGSGKYYPLTKGTRHLRSGAVYEIPTSDTSIQSGNAKYLGKWEDAAAIAQWQLETQAAETEDEMFRAHKRDADGRAELLELLQPLRAVYQKTIGTSRRDALEIALLRALRTPLRKKEAE
jgi:hypothetical protein